MEFYGEVSYSDFLNHCFMGVQSPQQKPEQQEPTQVSLERESAVLPNISSTEASVDSLLGKDITGIAHIWRNMTLPVDLLMKAPLPQGEETFTTLRPHLSLGPEHDHLLPAIQQDIQQNLLPRWEQEAAWFQSYAPQWRTMEFSPATLKNPQLLNTPSALHAHVQQYLEFSTLSPTLQQSMEKDIRERVYPRFVHLSKALRELDMIFPEELMYDPSCTNVQVFSQRLFDLPKLRSLLDQSSYPDTEQHLRKKIQETTHPNWMHAHQDELAKLHIVEQVTAPEWNDALTRLTTLEGFEAYMRPLIDVALATKEYPGDSEYRLERLKKSITDRIAVLYTEFQASIPAEEAKEEKVEESPAPTPKEESAPLVEEEVVVSPVFVQALAESPEVEVAQPKKPPLIEQTPVTLPTPLKPASVAPVIEKQVPIRVEKTATVIPPLSPLVEREAQNDEVIPPLPDEIFIETPLQEEVQREEEPLLSPVDPQEVSSDDEELPPIPLAPALGETIEEKPDHLDNEKMEEKKEDIPVVPSPPTEAIAEELPPTQTIITEKEMLPDPSPPVDIEVQTIPSLQTTEEVVHVDPEIPHNPVFEVKETFEDTPFSIEQEEKPFPIPDVEQEFPSIQEDAQNTPLSTGEAPSTEDFAPPSEELLPIFSLEETQMEEVDEDSTIEEETETVAPLALEMEELHTLEKEAHSLPTSPLPPPAHLEEETALANWLHSITTAPVLTTEAMEILRLPPRSSHIHTEGDTLLEYLALLSRCTVQEFFQICIHYTGYYFSLELDHDDYTPGEHQDVYLANGRELFLAYRAQLREGVERFSSCPHLFQSIATSTTIFVGLQFGSHGEVLWESPCSLG